MPAFRYQAYSAAGQVEAGTIEAASQPDAVKLLAERGLLPFETKAVSAGGPSGRAWLTRALARRLSLAEYAEVMRELGVLLNAGLPLDQALRLMADQSTSVPARRLAQSLVDSVTAGSALSAAIERHATGAPAYVASLTRAGEARGSLGSTLMDLATFLQKRADIEARVRSALTYPAVLAVTALGAIVVIATFLVPALLPLFVESGVEPPLAFVVVQRTGAFVSTYWPALAVALGLALMLATRLLRREAVRLAVDRLLLRMPLIGDVVAHTNMAVLARTLGTLLRHGVALVPALSMTAAVVTSRPFAQVLRAGADGVREGRRLGAILGDAPDVPKLLVRFVIIGEEASKLDDMLLHLAELSDTHAQRQIDKLMTLLTPALTIIVGLVVGGLILSVLQGILSVNQLAFR